MCKKFCSLIQTLSFNSKKTVVIEGRSANFTTHKDSTFLDISTGKGSSKNNTYAITSNGYLCLFSPNKLLEKWVNLKCNTAYAVSVTEKIIACGCSDGVIRLFDPISLEYINTVIRPHCLGKEYLGKESVTR